MLISLLEDGLELLNKEGLSCLKHALLGSNDLLVEESVVLSNGFLVLQPLFALALMKFCGGINDDFLELFELSEDLAFDLVVVVLALVGIKLLGKVRDRSPEVVLLLLKLVSNDLSGLACGCPDCHLIQPSLHLDALTDVCDAISKCTGGHGEGSLCSQSLDG